MWIKTMEDCYLNTDTMSDIYWNRNIDSTECTMNSGTEYAICKGNRTLEIIQNIISGTKIMEVQ